MSRKRAPTADSTTDTEIQEVPEPGPLLESPAPRLSHDDDRPTELFDRTRHRELTHQHEQTLEGSTIREIMANGQHRLSDALGKLVELARRDLPGAEVDARTSLRIRHQFEFDRRVGYSLALRLLGEDEQIVEVVAELDQDGRAIRSGSMISKLITI